MKQLERIRKRRTTSGIGTAATYGTDPYIPETYQTMYVYTDNGQGLNVRSTPYVGNNIIGLAPYGSEVKVVRFLDNGWACIVWYGGEPLLAFDRMLSINKRLQDMGKIYTASLITNGYLLTDEKIARLNDLKVTYLQITLDGTKETHDARRYLRGGGPTYDTIIENVHKVMCSPYKGAVHIRVNVDGRNDNEFAYIYNYMRKKYPKSFGKRITVYPGFVKGDEHPDHSCFFEPVQQGEFIRRMMENYQIAPLPLFPKERLHFGCVLTRRNSYVVGPKGELYKCWDDVCSKDKIIGYVDKLDDWNMGLLAEGMVGASYLDDPVCKECMYFPICNGGCHRIRQQNLHREEKHCSCSYFKDNLEDLLELYYEFKQRKAAAAKAAAEKKENTGN